MIIASTNDLLLARYLLIIEHYEIFFVWLFNMHLGWLLYAGCTAFSRPSLPVIFTFASHCDQHGSVLPSGHLLIWVYQRFARDRMLKGDSTILPCDSARMPFRCDHNIQPSRIGIRLMLPGCRFHVCLRFIDERRGLHPVLSLGMWPYAGDAQPIHYRLAVCPALSAPGAPVSLWRGLCLTQSDSLDRRDGATLTVTLHLLVVHLYWLSERIALTLYATRVPHNGATVLLHKQESSEEDITQYH